MEYPFTTYDKYGGKKVQEAVDDFIDSGLWSNDVCTNGAGESRCIEDVRLPFGVIVSSPNVPIDRRTVYMSGSARDGSRRYHTPYATYENGEEPLIMYKQDGVLESCLWSEFEKWLGDKYTVSDKPPDPVDPKEANIRRMILAQGLAKHKLEEAKEKVAEQEKAFPSEPEDKAKKGKGK